MELEKDEVIDFSGENFNKYSISCSVGLLIILSIALVNFILIFLFPGTYISTYISLGLIFIFVLYYSYMLMRNPGKLRKFSISNEEIEFLLPNIPLFRIFWSEFEEIEIRMRKFNYKPYCRYEFHFIYRDSDNIINLSLFDFHKEKIDEILVLIKDYAKKMKKKFKAIKETNISGIILQENFKIKVKK
ncbi:MAG: hypothetical protein ACFE8C_04645 [Promethearchaeota archaeon]